MVSGLNAKKSALAGIDDGLEGRFGFPHVEAGSDSMGLLPAAPRKSPTTATSGLKIFDITFTSPYTGKVPAVLQRPQLPVARRNGFGRRRRGRWRSCDGRRTGPTLECGKSRLERTELLDIALPQRLELLTEAVELLADGLRVLRLRPRGIDRGHSDEQRNQDHRSDK